MLPGPIDRFATLQRDEQGGRLLVPVVDRVVELGAGAIDVIPAADELVIVDELIVGELTGGELSVEDVRLELDPNAAEVDGIPLSPVGGLKLDPNPLGLDANPPGLDSVPDRLLGDPVRLDDTVDDVVDGSDEPLVRAAEPTLVDGEVLRRELPILDDGRVLEDVGLDPTLGMQGVSSG